MSVIKFASLMASTGSSEIHWLAMVPIKEYPVYITLRTDSLTLRLPEEGLSQPLSACTDGSYSDGQVVHDHVQYTADRAERGWESASHGRRRGGGLSVLRVI